MKNTYAAKQKVRILELMPSTEENSLPLNELADITGFNKRQIKRMIAELRKDYPICAKETEHGGYWISYDRQDIEKFVNLIESRMESHLRTINNMRSHL